MKLIHNKISYCIITLVLNMIYNVSCIDVCASEDDIIIMLDSLFSC